MTAPPTSEPSTIHVMLVALAFAGGYLDAVSYLGLGHVFTANMTGNTVLLGIAIAGMYTSRVIGSLIALVGYCTGVAAGTFILYSRRRHIADPSKAWRTLVTENALIILLMLLWVCTTANDPSSAAKGIFIAISAIAMGMQTEAARCMSIGGVATTFVTGTLSDLSAGLVARLLGAKGEFAGHRSAEHTKPGWRFLLAVWPAYLTGGATGAFAVVRWTGRALLAPVGIVGVVSAIAYAERRRWFVPAGIVQ